MIEQLRVRSLGVIDDIDITLGPGLTAITGETGTGKTLIVEALELLVGGKSDASLVRFGQAEAIVEGLFVVDDKEMVVSRVVPQSGRSRASIDDRLATIAALEEFGRSQIDLYGQHAHQSLLRQVAQRQALDEFAAIDLDQVRMLRQQLAHLDERLRALGGDETARRRELDLLSFELNEIDGAKINGPDENEDLEKEEVRLSFASSLRAACEAAYESLRGGAQPGALDLLGTAIEATGRYDTLEDATAQLRALAAGLADSASDLRRLAESFEEDPTRLEEVTERRQMLFRLIRKHGGSLVDVLRAAESARERVDELSSSEERRGALGIERDGLLSKLGQAEDVVGSKRRQAASGLAAAVQENLRELALANASLEVLVGEGIGDDVNFLLSANRGEPPMPLSKVASGGELARVMLALRLVLSSAPPTMIFDEVDAGIGGEAALAVGKALAALGRQHQVLVVTHLAQVAAFADSHFVVEKDEQAGRTISRCVRVEGKPRVVELSRMLSGHPDSAAARRHAAELLEQAVLARG
ncbi:MAG TPA: DNA repair protein RecN [Acidimicrobiales bacterium]